MKRWGSWIFSMMLVASAGLLWAGWKGLPPSVRTRQAGISQSGEEIASSIPQVQPRALPSLPTAYLEQETVAQGGFTAVILRGAQDPQTATLSGDLTSPTGFCPVGDRLCLLIPVSWDTQPGRYELLIGVDNYTLPLTLTVTQRDFEQQHLEVAQETVEQTVANQQANDEFMQKLQPLKQLADPVAYWDSYFVEPLIGPETTPFGAIRYTNDDPTPTRHGGVDIAAPEGSVISAVQNGRVLFAGFMELTGNTVVIEHGLGLKSWYYHMQQLEVSEGEEVTCGQPVGTVGQTGFSTGPHLHYALSIGTVFVDPWQPLQHRLLDF